MTHDNSTWVAETTQDTIFSNMISEYMLARGTKSLQDFIPWISTKHDIIASAQDKLDWDNFIEGRIARSFKQHTANTIIDLHKWNPQRWEKTFVKKIFQATHKQWTL